MVTFDHEHVPTEHLHALAEAGVAVRPGPEALVHAQDKAVMRARLTALGLPVPAARRRGDAPADVEAFGLPVRAQDHPRRVRRPRGLGGPRAGRGARRRSRPPAQTGVQVLAEELVDFRRELAALVARVAERPGRGVPGRREHPARRHLPRGRRPGARPGDPSWPRTPSRSRSTIAKELDVVGILAVELFETRDGRVLVNELAMRPHNTGHWTQDGAVTSQFENHLRAVLDLPLGSPAPRAPWTVMVNILGGPTDQVGGCTTATRTPWPATRGLRVHLYGKELRPGRKVGHVNAYGDDLEDCLERARHAAAWFRGDLGNESE